MCEPVSLVAEYTDTVAGTQVRADNVSATLCADWEIPPASRAVHPESMAIFRTIFVRRGPAFRKSMILWRSLRASNRRYSLESAATQSMAVHPHIRNAAFIGVSPAITRAQHKELELTRAFAYRAAPRS
jgi:hypothetical protein